jgi:hypothetical protein
MSRLIRNVPFFGVDVVVGIGDRPEGWSFLAFFTTMTRAAGGTAEMLSVFLLATR